MSRSPTSIAAAFALCLAAGCSKAESHSAGLPAAPAAAPTGETAAVPGAPTPAPAGETVAVPGAPAPGTAPAAPGAAPAAPASGAPDTSFQLTVTAPAPGAAGAEAVARVTVVPGAGYKMNKEYPTRLVVQPPAGVTVAKADMVLADATFDPHKLSFDVKVVAAKAGTYPVAGTIKFAVCTDATCDPKKQPIAFDVVAR